MAFPVPCGEYRYFSRKPASATWMKEAGCGRTRGKNSEKADETDFFIAAFHMKKFL
jgi:hypothetical protein